MANDCHDEKGLFCEGGGGGSSDSRPSVAINRVVKADTVDEHGNQVTEWRTDKGEPLPKHLDGLKIPPAWTDVQVNPDPEGSLLVTGHDVKGRLQYVYSPKFMETQKAAKFARITELDRQFDEIKAANALNRADPAKAEEADCMHVIMETGIRPGSDRDTKAAKQAYGATTLRGEHVVQTDEGVRLRYVGKKGVDLDIPIENPETAAMLVSRAERAGADGRLFDTDSHTLLQYSHTLGSGQFKTKDMRTLVGTSMAKSEIAKIPAPTSKTAYKKAVSTVAKAVSKKLGNTPSVALKSYIAPEVFDAWSGAAAFGNAEGREPLFDFDIMIGTACKLREKPVRSISVVDADPEGNDEDIPCPPDVRMALGFDPDELDEDKSHQVCIGNHCFFGNAVSIAPSEHIAVLQGLNTWINYARPFGPQRFYYGADDFRGSEPEWETTPVVFAQQHPAHRLVAANLDAALKSVRAHDGGPGRIAGRIKTPLIVGDATPDLMAEVVFDDPYVQRMHAENRLALSTGFTAGHDDEGYLTERVKPNHLLVFVSDEKNQPRDPGTGFLNKEGSDMTDEVDETTPAGDKSKQGVDPKARQPEDSTDGRLKALIADLLKRLDAVFVSAEQLSEQSGDANDPDPAVSGKGQAPADEEKANANDCHDEKGMFCAGGGSGGSKEPTEKARAERAKAQSANVPKIKSPEDAKAVLAMDSDKEIVKLLSDKSLTKDDLLGRRDAIGRIRDDLPDEAKKEIRAATKMWDIYSAAFVLRREYPDADPEKALKHWRNPTKHKMNQDFANADYPWDDCIEQQLAKGYSEERASKICGYIKAKNNLQEMRAGRSPAGSDPEEAIMGAEMDALKSKLDAANQRLAGFEQAQKDAAWENMKTSHVPKGWLAAPDDAAKANKEADLRKEYETDPVGFANKILNFAKGKGGQDKSKEEGAAFGNKGEDGNDVLSVTRELRASSGRR